MKKIKRLIYQKLSTLVFLVVLVGFASYVPKSSPVMGKPEKIKLAVLMYHGITQNGQESTYVIKDTEFEKDILYLKKEGFTFVGTEDILDFYKYGTPVGEKCVMITFDDGYLNNYTFAFPIIKKHGIKAVFSPIAICSDLSSENGDSNTIYSHITWNQVKEMAESGLVEFQNHSYDMHTFTDQRKGSAKAKDETAEEFREKFFQDTKKAHNAIRNATGKAPDVYVFPFGSYCPEMKSILKCSGYEMSLGCQSGYNYLTGDIKELWNIKRFNRTNVEDASQLLSDY